MLFTPSPPYPPQTISSSVESHLSSTHPSTGENPTPRNDILNVTSRSSQRPNQAYDQELFHSPHSFSSSSRPSIHLSPIKKPTSFKLLKKRRRLSYPNSAIHQKTRRFHSPIDLAASIRHAFMAAVPLPDPHAYYTESQVWSNTNIMPVANPAAAAALVEDNDIVLSEEQELKSTSQSPVSTPKHSDQIARSPTVSSAHQLLSSSNRKVVLNVGGVRHESKSKFVRKKTSNFKSFSSPMANTSPSSKYSSRTFS